MDFKSRYFGDKWEAGLFDDPDFIEQVPTPVGEKCIICLEKIKEGDQGTQYINGPFSHKECGLRSVMGGVGHHVNCAKYCKGELGSDAGFTKRESAIMVYQMYTQGRIITEDTIEFIKEIRNPNSETNRIAKSLGDMDF